VLDAGALGAEVRPVGVPADVVGELIEDERDVAAAEMPGRSR
jgi:hypothetical protein